MNIRKNGLGLALVAPVGLLGAGVTGASAAPLVTWAPYASCQPVGAVGISLNRSTGTLTAKAATGDCASNALGKNVHLVIINPAGVAIETAPVAPVKRWMVLIDSSYVYKAETKTTAPAGANGRYQACAQLIWTGGSTPWRCADLVK